MNESHSWESNSLSAGQEIPQTFCNPKVQRVSWDKSSPRRLSYFMKMSFNIILPSEPESSKWPSSIIFRHQIPVWTSPFPTCMLNGHHSNNTRQIPMPVNRTVSHSKNEAQVVQVVWTQQVMLTGLYQQCVRRLFGTAECKKNAQSPLHVFTANDNSQ